MRKFLFLSLLVNFVVFTVNAQAEVKRTVFIPPEYYMGDPVELRLLIELDNNEQLMVPTDIIPFEWVEITDVQVVQSNLNGEIIVKFTSFSPGTRALPEMDFGSFVLSDFKIYTNSLVQEGESDLKGLRPQVMIPGSKLYFFLIALGVFVLPYLLFFLVRLIIRYSIALARKYHSSGPYRTLSRTLKKLDSNIEKISVRDFFITLSDALRIYLTARIGYDCKSATTSEISTLHGFGLDQSLWDQLVILLKRGDMVKFGGEKLSLKQMKDNLEFVVTLSYEIEKREDFHVDI